MQVRRSSRQRTTYHGVTGVLAIRAEMLDRLDEAYFGSLAERLIEELDVAAFRGALVFRDLRVGGDEREKERGEDGDGNMHPCGSMVGMAEVRVVLRWKETK